MIAEEVAQLGTKLRQERDIEIARAADLKELLKEFDETIVEKQAEIEKEQDLLAQMQALRGQVDEASIRAPIETAMAKKVRPRTSVFARSSFCFGFKEIQGQGDGEGAITG
ncbi:unnamed protein product [Ectocarpus sp. 12 AP-2014]